MVSWQLPGYRRRYPVEEMTDHELTFWSGFRNTVFVSVVACIPLLALGCSRVAGEHRHQHTPVGAALNSEVSEGPELHESLRTRRIGSIRDLPHGLESPGNPYLSTDGEFVQAMARGGGSEGLAETGFVPRSSPVTLPVKASWGFTGLEAETGADAEEREQVLREIRACNGRLGRSRVHRRGRVLPVVRHDDVFPESRESVNAAEVEHLNAALHNDGWHSRAPERRSPGNFKWKITCRRPVLWDVRPYRSSGPTGAARCHVS